MTRREFIGTGGAALALLAAGCRTGDLAAAEVIDCHTHFYDPSRPQGVPWPPKGDARLYRRVLPADYEALARPLGVTGTVVVEASEWLEDNQWVLDLAAREPFIVGLVGNLKVGDDAFAGRLQRFAGNPLFRGIRIRGSDMRRLGDPAVRRDLRRLADHDLALDVNGGPELLPSIVQLANDLPVLRLIIDHVSNVRIDGGTPPREWLDGMARAAAFPNVFCKVSGLVEGGGRRGGAPRNLSFYRPVLDHVWRNFGEDRVIYGSNWPVSELFAEFATVHGIVCEYFSAKGPVAQRKFFAENSRAFYKWPQKRR
jgi:L-fuconolactonase